MNIQYRLRNELEFSGSFLNSLLSHFLKLLNQAKISLLIFQSRYQGQAAQLALTVNAVNESEPSRLSRKSRRL